MPERDELDVLIDSALNIYAEPRPGLEQRMLARVSSELARPSGRRPFLLAIAGLVTASLLLLTYLFLMRPHSQPQEIGHSVGTPPLPAHVAVPDEPRTASQQVPGARVRRRRTSGLQRVQSAAIERPKLDIFPMPKPLDVGERVLTRFASQAPEADRKAFLEARQGDDGLLTITAIRIPPLPSPEENQH